MLVLELVALGGSLAFSLRFFLELGFAVTRRLVLADEDGFLFCLCPTVLRVLRDFALEVATSIVCFHRYRPYKADILLTAFPVKRGT